ncbi:MAG: FHA domain-containing protein [Actinobacteria bacterium]|nr:FHA domain-containing protein [Actinomycetota bacterium]
MVSDQLLNVLKICLLALLYLFFLRVLRAVWVEVKGPVLAREHAPSPVATGDRHRRRRAPSCLKVVEPPALAGARYELSGEFTLGRAAGCQVTLDDTFASQIHARVFDRDDHVYVEDLGSTNGTWLNRAKVTGPLELSRGDRLQIGNTVFEVA